MANFPILYTGKDSDRPIDFGADEAFESFADRMLSARKMKLDKALQDEKFLLDTQLDPMGFVTDAAVAEQAEFTDWFNNKWSARMARNDGILSTQDKLERASDKRKGIAVQQNLMNSQQWAQREADIISRDYRGRYDKGEFQKRWANFMETGLWPKSGLVVAPRSVTDYLARRQGKDTTRGGTYERPTSTVGTEEGFQRAMIDIFTGAVPEADAMVRKITIDFDGLKPDEKAKWLIDTDKDGTISGDENYNGIREWAMQNNEYRNAFIVEKEDSYRRGTSDKGGFTFNFLGKDVKYTPPVQEKLNIGGVTYSDVYRLPNTKGAVSFNRVDILRNGQRRQRDLGGAFEPAMLVAYVPQEDAYAFEMYGDAYKGSTFLAKAEDLQGDMPVEFRDIQVVGKDGNLITIGELSKQAPFTTLTINPLNADKRIGGSVEEQVPLKEEEPLTRKERRQAKRAAKKK